MLIFWTASGCRKTGEDAQTRARNGCSDRREGGQKHIKPAIGRTGVDKDRRVGAGEPGHRRKAHPKGRCDSIAQHAGSFALEPKNIDKFVKLPLADEGVTCPCPALARRFEGLHRGLIDVVTGPQHEWLGYAKLSQVAPERFVRDDYRIGAIKQFLGQSRFAIEAFHAQIAARFRGVGSEDNRMAEFG